VLNSSFNIPAKSDISSAVLSEAFPILAIAVSVVSPKLSIEVPDNSRISSTYCFLSSRVVFNPSKKVALEPIQLFI
jgi:hypothetical protein